jgi:hypothetical protein
MTSVISNIILGLTVMQAWEDTCVVPAKKHPEAAETLKKEAKRINAVNQTIKAMKVATITRDLFLIGTEILDEYKKLKAVEANEGSRVASKDAIASVKFDIICKEGSEIKLSNSSI